MSWCLVGSEMCIRDSPTVEHFTPLFITLGAATNPEDAPENKIAGYFMGLSKRSIQVA
jgi:4,5-DOPA dioxygenase extradiol